MIGFGVCEVAGDDKTNIISIVFIWLMDLSVIPGFYPGCYDDAFLVFKLVRR